MLDEDVEDIVPAAVDNKDATQGSGGGFRLADDLPANFPYAGTMTLDAYTHGLNRV